MIKIKNNKVKMEGNRPDLLTDLTFIVKGLKECFEEDGTSKEVSEKLIREAVDIAFWDEEKLAEESNKLVEKLVDLISRGLKRMNKNTYEPETLEEEFAFLVGRVAALEAVMNKDDSDYIKKEDVAAILGIEFKERKEKNAVL